MMPGKDAGSLTAFDICSKPVVTISDFSDVDGAVDVMNDY